jgi:hypothetical protein
MPAMAPSVAQPQQPTPAALPSAIELPPAIEVTTTAAAAPRVQTVRPKKGAVPSVQDRLRKKTNPLAIFFTIIIIIVVIGAGVASVLWNRVEKAKRQFADQMIGNWELVPGQSQLERWDFAFHNDRTLQMALGTQLSKGWWSVTSVHGTTGYVSISWSDGTRETIHVRLEGGTMQVQLDSVGNFAFRAAVP